MTKPRWSEERLRQVEEEVGLAPASSNPMPRVAPDRVRIPTTGHHGDPVPVRQRLLVVCIVSFLVGIPTALLGAHNGHQYLEGQPPAWWAVGVGIALCMPGTLVVVGASFFAAGRFARWVATGR